jgi:hypothetical protein
MVEGHDIHYDRLVEAIQKNGGVVHSIDEVSVTKSKEKPHTTLTPRPP